MYTFINILRELKRESVERFKMQRHYGLIGSLREKFKALSSGNAVSRAQANDSASYAVSADLDAKLKRIKDLYRIDKRLFENSPKITFISFSIPRPDSTSSEFRLFNLLKILLNNNCTINFLSYARPWNEKKYTKMLGSDITFNYIPLNVSDYVKAVARISPQYIWITELWRIDYVKFITELTRELKTACPSSKLIVDTIDFHYKEFKRKFDISGNPEDLSRAKEFLDSEKVLYRDADATVVISEDEKKDIQSEISGINRIEVIPNIHNIHFNARPYEKRKNICFVGHFGNKHNVDAVSYFLENVFHLILKRNPWVEFHILGYAADKYRKQFKSPNVKVIGGLKYLEEALTHYKLFVCPMIYGAGMKGKIGGAIAAGVPVVTTSIGAEGFPLTDGEEYFIADSPATFAEKCNQCLSDPVIWHNFSVKSRLMLAENLSPGSVAEKLKKILSE